MYAEGGLLKKRSKRSVVTERRLAINPDVANSVRSILARELQNLAQMASNPEARFICLKPARRLHFLLNETKLTITVPQIETFGIELKTKGFLNQVVVNNREVHYYPTDAGWTALRSGSPLVYQAPREVYSPDLKTQQKTVIQKRESAARKALQEGWASAENDIALPLAADYLIPMLKAAQSQPLQTEKLIRSAAQLMGVPENQSRKLSTNQTFVTRTQWAIKYLVSHGFLKKTKRKTLALTRQGQSLFERPAQMIVWLGFKEPEVRTRPKVPPPEVYPSTRNARLSGQVVVPNALKKIGDLGLDELVTMRQNANRLLSKPDQKGSHEKAQTVIDRVTAELDRRFTGEHPDDYFRWPTTEAPGGNGSLTLDKSEKEGMLAYLEYHVGRTLGHSSRIRQSTLTRVFECSLPPVFDEVYLRTWGPNGSAQRLQKMAESIAAFTRNAKHRNPDVLDEAIRQWEQDLNFLHERYYVGKFHFDFAWPTTSIS